MPSLGERFSVEGSTERKKYWVEASLGVKRGEGEGHAMPGAEGRVQGGRRGLGETLCVAVGQGGETDILEEAGYHLNDGAYLAGMADKRCSG